MAKYNLPFLADLKAERSFGVSEAVAA